MPRKSSTVSHSRRAGNAPSPSTYAACGHSHCDEGRCRVRYIGATSPIHHHHILHAAKGVSHVWTAAIIAGLAVVITGAAMFASANADLEQKDSMRLRMATELLMGEMKAMNKQLSGIQDRIQNMESSAKDIYSSSREGLDMEVFDQVFARPPR